MTRFLSGVKNNSQYANWIVGFFFVSNRWILLWNKGWMLQGFLYSKVLVKTSIDSTWCRNTSTTKFENMQVQIQKMQKVLMQSWDLMFEFFSPKKGKEKCIGVKDWAQIIIYARAKSSCNLWSVVAEQCKVLRIFHLLFSLFFFFYN